MPIDTLLASVNEPRNARHMPLTGEPFTADSARAWAAAKDAQWSTNGDGLWAVWVDGDFVGWGGFQLEETGADFGLVLDPAHWGTGLAVATHMLNAGVYDLGLTVISIALPLSRSDPARAIARLGFRPAGSIELDGVRFRHFRLDAREWRAMQRR